MSAAGLMALAFLLVPIGPALGVIRDGSVDPANLGKGEWIASMKDATNRLGGHISSVTNEHSLMLYYKSRGIRHVIVKAAANADLYKDCYSTPQFTSNLVDIAHAYGLLIFGYNRSWGQNIAAEIGISDYVFTNKADGFVWDAEGEWEDTTNRDTHLPDHPWITNGPAQAVWLCGTVRSNWPTKFLAHAPFPIISWHATFPYKEFGYWCDAAMPQIYYYNWTGVKSSPSGGINWSDANWASWQGSLAHSNSVVNGQMMYWTNAIKPLAPVNNVYGEQITGGAPCFGNNVANMPAKNVMEFIDYLSCDPNCVSPGGHQGANFFRTALHGTNQWANIGAGTIGLFAGVVNNLVMDDPQATTSGSWTVVRTFSNGAFYGSSGNGTSSDTNSFGTNYLTRTLASGNAYEQFTPNIVVPGDYDVYQWHPYLSTASTRVPFEINYHGGNTTISVNQQTNDGNWSLIGRFNFAAGTAGYVRVKDSATDSGKVAIADGVKLVFAGSTMLGSSANPSVYGNSVTLTATVTENAGPAPTGTVTFKDGAVSLRTAVLNGVGQATFTTNKLSVAGSPHSLTALYSGDSNYGSNTSSVLLQAITRKALTVSGITASDKVYDGTTNATLNTSGAGLVGVVSGDTVTLNTGSVAGAFTDANVGSNKTVNISGLGLTGADAGNYSLTAPAATASITGASSTTSLISLENPSGPGTNVTFRATVGSAAGTPDGGVVFRAGGVPFSTNSLSGGVAAASTASLPLGTNHIEAEYAGAGNFLGSSGSVNQVVKLFVTCSQTNVLLSVADNRDGTLTLTFVGTPQAQYCVLASSSVAAAMTNWAAVAGSTNTVTNVSGLWQFRITNTAPQRFYRGAAVVPCP